jgi:hypothetical protein
MATIYEFIVRSQEGTQDQQVTQDVVGNPIPLKGAGTKVGGVGTSFNFGGTRGGVDHNRYMRPINPLINRITGGYWEKGTRVGRALNQLPSDIKSYGFGALTGVASLILVQFAIMEVDKYIREQRKKAKEENQSNFLKQKSGESVLSGSFRINRNFFGKITYDQLQGTGSGARLR